MIELTHHDGDMLRFGFAGDTYNTAVYLARNAPHDSVSIDYVTVIGDDWYSDRMLDAMQSEGIGDVAITRLPGRSPGLYLVRTSEHGERSFTYYRDTSPARTLFDTADADLSSYDMVYLSAITLQILTPEARERLWAALATVRANGGRVAFDTNYRPAGWSSVQDARSAIERTLTITDIALPTLNDEQLLYDDLDADACLDRIAASGVPEIVVKDGPNGCVVHDPSTRELVAGVVAESVVDTTAAGDSFNGAYLAARLAGATPVAAAAAGHAMAVVVIGHPGAIVPATVLPRRPYGHGRTET
ncbi:MAG: 2-dehydro-3-deoxygluconokinase [Frankiaceae bacterium]|nr:2-dehydro-3-deoxygluconokinase [Frankiaceae bacterium]